MTNRLWLWVRALAVASTLAVWPLFAGADTVGAADPTAQPSMVATPWGAPDLQGVWNFSTLTPLQRPSELARKPFFTEEEAAEYAQTRLSDIRSRAPDGSIAATVPGGIAGAIDHSWREPGTTTVATRRTSLIVDPPDGRLPPLTTKAQKFASSPEAKRLDDANVGSGPADSWHDLWPGDRCIQHMKAGPPINPGGYNSNIQLFQTPNYVAILNEQIHDVRLIPLDGRPHLGQHLRQWMGDSRGRWESQVLVVETTNFNGKHEQIGRPSPLLVTAENLSLIERFTRLDAETLLYEYTVRDPTTWVRPWTAQLTMKKTQDKIYEYACHEGNYSLPLRLSGARVHDKTAEKATRKKGSL